MDLNNYDGPFPDMEDLVCEWIEQNTRGVSPAVSVVTWLPADSAERVERGEIIVRVARMAGGAITPAGRLDTGEIQIAAWAAKRSLAWKALAYVGEVMAQLGENKIVTWPDGTQATVAAVTESDERPVQVPDVALDQRLVWGHWQVTTRRQR